MALGKKPRCPSFPLPQSVVSFSDSISPDTESLLGLAGKARQLCSCDAIPSSPLGLVEAQSASGQEGTGVKPDLGWGLRCGVWAICFIVSELFCSSLEAGQH